MPYFHPTPKPERQAVTVVARSGERYTHHDVIEVRSSNGVNGPQTVITSLLPNGDGTHTSTYYGAETLSYHPQHLPPG